MADPDTYPAGPAGVPADLTRPSPAYRRHAYLAVAFVRRGPHDAVQVEITAAEHPRLFAFLHRLADEARAPRPHRVFLSPRVNAAVFYDLSIANLILPSKKNLEIGLGLINVLTLGELKAVLAHELDPAPHDGQLESYLTDRGPDARAFLERAAAAVMLGDACPPAWREHVRRALFVPERPYLRAPS